MHGLRLCVLVGVCLASQALGGDFTLYTHLSATPAKAPDLINQRVTVVAPTPTWSGTILVYRENGGVGGAFFFNNGILTPSSTAGTGTSSGNYLNIQLGPQGTSSPLPYRVRAKITAPPAEVSPDFVTFGQTNYTMGGDTNGNTVTHTDTIVVNFGADPCPPRDLTFILNASLKLRTEGTLTLTVDGQVVRSYSIPAPMYAGRTSFNVTEGPITTTDGSFSYSWKFNGTVIADGSYTCEDEIVDDTVLDTVVWDQPAAPPDESEDPENPDQEPVPGKNPEGQEPLGTDPNKPPAGSQPAANSYNNSAPLETQGDMYKAVREALDHAGNQTSVTGIPEQELEDIADDLERRGKLDDIQDQLDDASFKMGQAKDIANVVNGPKSWLEANVPSSLGSVSSVTLGTVNISGTSKALTLDFSTMATPISLFRSAVLFSITVVFAIVCIQTVRHYL